MRRAPALASLAVALALPAGASIAQELPGQRGAPVTIEADKGIEWRQVEKVYVARGNAIVKRGDITVRAETLTAHYRGKPGGKNGGASLTGAVTKAGSSVWKVTAAGGVVITQANRTIRGAYGVYNLETGVARLTGRNIKMNAPGEKLSAKRFIEYRTREKMAIVDGDASLTKDDKQVDASRFTAYFNKGPDGKLQIERVIATGNVVITTPNDVVKANRAFYNHKTQIARLIGAVKLTRGDNQLNGDQAIVNLKTGVSQLIAANRRGRVKGIFVPGGETGGTPGAGGPAIPGLPGQGKPAKK